LKTKKQVLNLKNNSKSGKHRKNQRNPPRPKNKKPGKKPIER
jgi:hypothetical protein